MLTTALPSCNLASACPKFAGMTLTEHCTEEDVGGGECFSSAWWTVGSKHCRTMQFCFPSDPFLDSWPVALRYLHNQMRSVSGRYRFRSNATSFFHYTLCDNAYVSETGYETRRGGGGGGAGGGGGRLCGPSP